MSFCLLTVHCQDVIQDPTISWSFKSKSAEMKCSHKNLITHTQMYWYRQRPGETMTLIVYTAFGGQPDYGENLQSKYSAVKDSIEAGALTVKDLQPDDSGIYFCASYDILCSDSYPAYFGEGTKLTVLDGVDVTAPTVKILRPSPLECRDQKKKEGKRRKTLVCVASGFYPDHVTVFWQLNGQNITDGVATDAAAKRNEITGLYSITSRLRLQAKTWFNPDNEFSCYVTFFNGTYTNYSTSIYSWWMGSGTLFKYSLTSIYIGETFF
uniref:Ig-like domain-containing protein n=1 Tax=Poecilia latipinna TaxID=48699 RepID=A0A3B3VYX6_9TELE